MASLAVVDISPFVAEEEHDDAARAQVAMEWDKAMTEVGFAIIVGHGVSQELIHSVRKGASGFFQQESSAKLAYSYGPYGNPLGGYTCMGTEAVTRTRAHGCGCVCEGRQGRQGSAMTSMVGGRS